MPVSSTGSASSGPALSASAPSRARRARPRPPRRRRRRPPASSSSASPSDALSSTAAAVPASAIAAIGSSWSPEAAGTVGAARLRDARRGRVSSSSTGGATGGWKTRLGGWNVRRWNRRRGSIAASTAGAAGSDSAGFATLLAPTGLPSSRDFVGSALVGASASRARPPSDDAAAASVLQQRPTACPTPWVGLSCAGIRSSKLRPAPEPSGGPAGSRRCARVGRRRRARRTVRPPVGSADPSETEMVMCRREPVRSRRLARCRASGGSLSAPGRIAPRRSLCRTAGTDSRSSGSLREAVGRRLTEGGVQALPGRVAAGRRPVPDSSSSVPCASRVTEVAVAAPDRLLGVDRSSRRQVVRTGCRVEQPAEVSHTDPHLPGKQRV